MADANTASYTSTGVTPWLETESVTLSDQDHIELKHVLGTQQASITLT